MTNRNRLEISTLEPTRYEVAILKNGLMVRVLGYAARQTKSVLKTYAAQNGSEVLGMLSDAEADSEYTMTARSIAFGSVEVAFTGRTERDAAS